VVVDACPAAAAAAPVYSVWTTATHVRITTGNPDTLNPKLPTPNSQLSTLNPKP